MSDPFIHFKVMVKERASDLILREGERPAMRCEGKIRFLSDERFTPEDAEALLSASLLDGGDRRLPHGDGEGHRVRRSPSSTGSAVSA